MQSPGPRSSGYAEAAEGLRVYYEMYGQGEPIVVMSGGFMEISSMAQVIGPLSGERQVIAIDLEGHGRTGLRDTPMSHERHGDDVAAVLRHLKIAKADVAGYSHGGDAAIRMAIQHPEMVRNLIVISTVFERDGWYPEKLKAMERGEPSMAEQMRKTPLFSARRSRPHPEQFPLLLDRMGELMARITTGARKCALSHADAVDLRRSRLGIDATHRRVLLPLRRRREGAGLGGKPKFSRARLAIVPGYSHYNFGQGRTSRG